MQAQNTIAQEHLEHFAVNLIKYSSAEVYIDLPTRLLYSTDASVYQMTPLAVVVPRHYDDVLATAELCIQEGLPMLPRGGGSSLAGQAVGEAVVLDFSKYLDEVVRVDGRARRALVQAGATLGGLNRRLASYGLMVGPDPASGDRATVGGCIGNNATGAHSIIYGKMVDHVIGLRAILADGRETWLGPVSRPEIEKQGGSDAFVWQAHRGLAALVDANRDLIDREFPTYWRRSGGYNLDRLRNQWAEDRLNLASLLVGAEGTLGLILEAELNLVPIPRHKALAVLHFADYDSAFRSVPGLLELGPSAIELIDEMLIDLTRKAPAWRTRLGFVEGDPQAVFVVEFAGDEEQAVEAGLQKLRGYWTRHGAGQPLVEVKDARAQANVWNVRKAGLNLLMSLRGDAKPIPGIEDVAVPPENLADYMAELRALLAEKDVVAAMYAHASAGCIHTRPILNLKTRHGVEILVELTAAAAHLAKKYRGALSSEHGDGLARSAFNRDFFGPNIYELFRRVKGILDPDNVFNPGKIVDAPQPDQNLRFGPDYRTIAIEPVWDWSRDGSYAQAVEMCNGAGVCRKLDMGTMCPSFQALRDEKHSTRGRANLLRAALSGQLPGGLADPALFEALELCLGCKACKSECPSSVDMTKLKTEAYAQKYRTEKPPLAARVFANIDRLSALAARVAPLANLTLRLPPTRWLMTRALQVHPERAFPRFHHQTLSKQWPRRAPARASGPTVALFPDTFTEFNEPEQGLAAARVLEAAGRRVELTPRLCCGRPALSQGLVPEAKARARRLVDALWPYAQAGTPIIGLEPSCLLTIRDDYPELIPGPRTDAVAKNVFLFDEYLAQLLSQNPSALPLKPTQRRYLVHGHCYQKTLTDMGASMDVLAMIPSASAELIDAGCCGMAGAFGYS
ncbi:MAG: FAD-binding protein, partial [Chloroflexi bacterium]|nr:FAD-binding protein [Chloroflexota bacterium]